MESKKLTPNQTRWIMEKATIWLDKYIAIVPMTDEQWEQCIAEMKGLINSARENALMKKVLLAGCEYLEEFEKSYKVEKAG